MLKMTAQGAGVPTLQSGLKKYTGMDRRGRNDQVKSVVMKAHILEAKPFDDLFG